MECFGNKRDRSNQAVNKNINILAKCGNSKATKVHGEAVNKVTANKQASNKKAKLFHGFGDNWTRGSINRKTKPPEDNSLPQEELLKQVAEHGHDENMDSEHVNQPIQEKKVLKRLCNESTIIHQSFQPNDSLVSPEAPLTTVGKACKKHVRYADETGNKVSEDWLSNVFNESANLKSAYRIRTSLTEMGGNLMDILEEDENHDQPCTWSEKVSTKSEKVCSKSSPLVLKGEYYVRTQSDQKRCSITGIAVLLDGRLVIADESNSNIKVISTSGDCLSYFDMPSEPWDVDTIGTNEVVVTFPNERCIRRISIDKRISTITILKLFNTDRQCFGIKCSKTELFVALENEIQILSVDGVLKTRLPSQKRAFPFSLAKARPSNEHYLTVDAQVDGQAIIYVSDHNKRCVVGVDRLGSTVCQYRDNGYNRMLGLCVGPDQKLLVCRSPRTLALVTFDTHGTRIRDLLDLENIQNVYFNPRDKKLWVTRHNNNFVSVYALKQNYVL